MEVRRGVELKVVECPYFYRKRIKILIKFVLISMHIKVSRTNTKKSRNRGFNFPISKKREME